ncbi:MAG: helix-hairpin-helix domain-containing protein [Fretibacterium sp.]
MWRTLWERHRGTFCVAVGMICFLAAGILVRGLPSVREHLSSLPPPSDTRDVRAPQPQERGGPSVSSSRETDPSGPSAQPTQPASGEWFLYVTGSVRRPGVYRLPPGARTVHLVDAAGGLDGFADPVAVNLAQPLADGMHVHVPRKGERQPQETLVVAAPTVRIGPPARSKAGGLIDVNRASETELTALRGIGPALARRIVEYREKNGPFRSVEELVLVRGIGAAKLEGFRDRATVGP